MALNKFELLSKIKDQNSGLYPNECCADPSHLEMKYCTPFRCNFCQSRLFLKNPPLFHEYRTVSKERVDCLSRLGRYYGDFSPNYFEYRLCLSNIYEVLMLQRNTMWLFYNQINTRSGILQNKRQPHFYGFL